MFERHIGIPWSSPRNSLPTNAISPLGDQAGAEKPVHRSQRGPSAASSRTGLPPFFETVQREGTISHSRGSFVTIRAAEKRSRLPSGVQERLLSAGAEQFAHDSVSSTSRLSGRPEGSATQASTTPPSSPPPRK